MEFLFPGAFIVENEFVFFHIHKISDEKYFAEVLDNPKGVKISDLYVTKKSSYDWITDDQSFSRLAQVIGEEIEGKK